jgi:hypothetical protein
MTAIGLPCITLLDKLILRVFGVGFLGQTQEDGGGKTTTIFLLGLLANQLSSCRQVLLQNPV